MKRTAQWFYDTLYIRAYIMNVRMQTQWPADIRYRRNEISILRLRRVDIALLYDVFLSQTIIRGLPGRDYGDGARLFQ